MLGISSVVTFDNLIDGKPYTIRASTMNDSLAYWPDYTTIVKGEPILYPEEDKTKTLEYNKAIPENTQITNGLSNEKYNFSAGGEPLPDGITVSKNGKLEGTPTEVGVVEGGLTITLKDERGVVNRCQVRVTYTVNKQKPNTPSMPTLRASATTADSLTLNAISPAEGTRVEYGIKADTGDFRWSENRTFTGLKQGTGYTFAARYTAVDREHYEDSEISAATESCFTKIRAKAPTISMECCKVTSNVSTDTEVPIGTTLEYRIAPCDLHTLKSAEIAGKNVDAGSIIEDKNNPGIYNVKYAVKEGDQDVRLMASVAVKKAVKLETLPASDSVFFANDASNTAEKIKTDKIDPIVLKATYDNRTEKLGTVQVLGIAWTAKAGNPAFDPKGGTYTYEAELDGQKAEQRVVVKAVNVTPVNPLPISKTVHADSGYNDYDAIGLPHKTRLNYTEGVSIDTENQEGVLTWTTPVPADFGKTVTNSPQPFEAVVAIPAWATLKDGEDTTVQTTVSIVDQLLLKPTVTITNKVYDGENTVAFEA
ncbi:MAG: hypothetical protein RR614_07955, partial [Eubacterium sp.]